MYRPGRRLRAHRHGAHRSGHISLGRTDTLWTWGAETRDARTQVHRSRRRDPDAQTRVREPGHRDLGRTDPDYRLGAQGPKRTGRVHGLGGAQTRGAQIPNARPELLTAVPAPPAETFGAAESRAGAAGPPAAAPAGLTAARCTRARSARTLPIPSPAAGSRTRARSGPGSLPEAGRVRRGLFRGTRSRGKSVPTASAQAPGERGRVGVAVGGRVFGVGGRGCAWAGLCCCVAVGVAAVGGVSRSPSGARV